MLHWLEVLYKPVKTFEKSKVNKKAVLNILIVFTVLAILQYFAISNLTSSVYIEALEALPDDFPMPLLVIIVTVFQLIITLVNIIFLTLLFKGITLLLFKGIKFKSILYIIILSQIPTALSVLINSFFIESVGDGMLLSLFGLGYVFSDLTENPIVLNFLNSFELFRLWSAFIITSGFYVYGKKYSLGKTFAIILALYILINTLTGLLL